MYIFGRSPLGEHDVFVHHQMERTTFPTAGRHPSFATVWMPPATGRCSVEFKGCQVGTRCLSSRRFREAGIVRPLHRVDPTDDLHTK
jgi:hypothetical protein